MQSDRTSVAPFAVLGVCLAIGLIIAGYFLAAAVMESRRGERTVTVSSTAERPFGGADSPEIAALASDLMREATKSAWTNANRFAEDTGNQLGAVRSAVQAPLVLTSAAEEPTSAKAEVTVTLEFFLK